MNEEIKLRWISALRSGEYNQTESRLGDGTGYCCLGVLCEIAVQDGIITKEPDPESVAVYTWVDDAGFPHSEEALLPTPVRDWAGLSSINPDVPATDTLCAFSEDLIPTYNRIRLSNLNDAGMPFSMIADEIESNL